MKPKNNAWGHICHWHTWGAEG